MSQPEVWLRGSLPDVPALLQPVAHSLLQSLEELTAAARRLTPDQLWVRPGDAASVGFHLRHAAGSLDRLFTYARGERLSTGQLKVLTEESEPDLTSNSVDTLLTTVHQGIHRALEQLRTTNEATLLEYRAVGRSELPSTVLGLLFHAAEHTQRHAGQAMTTAKVVTASQSSMR